MKDRENFIPLRGTELIELLCRNEALAKPDQERFHSLCRLFHAVRHLEYHRHLDELKEAYAPFDPDADTVSINEFSAEEKQERLNELVSEFAWIMERGNFKHLSRDELDPLLQTASDWGIVMDVDFHAFERLAIFARGEAVEKRCLRRWRTGYRKEEREVPIFRRLVMLLKLRKNHRLGRCVDPDKVYLQVFKDIPRQDITMLLPGARARMRVLDRGKIGLPLLSGLAIVLWQVLRDVVAFFTQYVVQILTLQPEALWVIATGSVGYSMRTYYGYVQTKQKYSLRLTEILYFQNLDTNAGVLFRLLDEAEEQEIREVVLAYFFLWRRAGPEGWRSEEVVAAVEQFLEHKAGVCLRFQVDDVLATLLRLKLVEQCQDRFRAHDLPEALDSLASTWSNFNQGAPACRPLKAPVG
jgi:hypothetical protein